MLGAIHPLVVGLRDIRHYPLTGLSIEAPHCSNASFINVLKGHLLTNAGALATYVP